MQSVDENISDPKLQSAQIATNNSTYRTAVHLERSARIQTVSSGFGRKRRLNEATPQRLSKAESRGIL
jgi:hypothetical protein